jgi:hypothetical protein
VNEVVHEGTEAITLTNGVSYVSVGGTTRQETPQDVVTEIAEDLGNGQWTFRNVSADEPNIAAAYFDTPQGEVGFFLAVQVTSPSTRFFIIWEHPVAEWEMEHTAFSALMEGLQYSVAT